MRKIAVFTLYFFSVVALSWFLPWLYSLLVSSLSREPFAAFSPVISQWVVSVNDDYGNTDIYSVDSVGKRQASYTRNQRDSLLPQLYYKDLMARESLPDTVGGKEVTIPKLRIAEFAFTSNRRDVNKNAAPIYLIMESMPERADLVDSDYVVRFNDGRMEFVRMVDNTINEKRTQRFTDAMNAMGFVMPAIDVSANITAHKQYDEGYLMVDSEGSVFHIKQRAGRPYIASVKLPEGVRGEKVFILENTDEKLLGFMTDTEKNPYFILKKDLTVVPLKIGKINPALNKINVMGNMFNIVFRIASDSATVWSAVDADNYSPLGSFVVKTSRENTFEEYLFPYQLNFNSSNDCLVYPRLTDFSINAVWLNFILATIILILYRRKSLSERVVTVCLTVSLGIYFFIPLIVIKR